MRTYDFQVIKGQSLPRRSIRAESHSEFYEELAKLEKREGVELVLDSIKCTVSEITYVPNPPATDKRDAFSPVEVAAAESVGMPNQQTHPFNDHTR